MGTFKNPDVWKQNLAYQIGDFVLYNGIVYMAIKPVPAGTAMSADYWYAFDEGAIVPTGEISITENGEVNVAQYATANVNVEGIVPTGEISITENGEVDVTEYATAIVNVEGGGDSDFSTATLTLTTPDSFQVHVIYPSFSDYGEGEAFAQASNASRSGEYNMILYKDACIVDITLDDTADPSQYSFSSTGDIEQVEDVGSYIATGDCAITITVK